MHGVKRSRVPPVPDTAAVAKAKHDKEQQKIEHYTSLVNQLYAAREANQYNDDTLAISGEVLRLNPEFQTGWGIRRTIILGITNQADATIKQAYLSADLPLTIESLKRNPKNYSVWEHRKWLLETMPEADWVAEFAMVNLYLKMDARNFHTWNYRRYLVHTIRSLSPDAVAARTLPLPPTSAASELAFTRKKIEENFSNYSAWHYRTKLLERLWAEKEWENGNGEREVMVAEEFEFVRTALWTNPDDQSSWLYHRWLVGEGKLPIVRGEIGNIQELLEEEPDSRWCLDSLVYYQRLLVTLLGSGDDTRAEREKLNLDSLDKLRKLEKVDPMRGARYRDLGEQKDGQEGDKPLQS